jgi:hypothetical protein
VHAPCKAPACICTPSSNHRIRGSTYHVRRGVLYSRARHAGVTVAPCVDMHYAAPSSVHAFQCPRTAWCASCVPLRAAHAEWLNAVNVFQISLLILPCTWMGSFTQEQLDRDLSVPIPQLLVWMQSARMRLPWVGVGYVTKSSVFQVPTACWPTVAPAHLANLLANLLPLLQLLALAGQVPTPCWPCTVLSACKPYAGQDRQLENCQ